MGAGAIDAVTTPSFGEAEARRILVEKIRSVTSIATPSAGYHRHRSQVRKEGAAHSCVLIGSSAGGPAALMTILEHLPESLNAAIVIVQHIDDHFSSELASWLDAKSHLPVRLAEDGEEPVAGEVLLSKGGRHLAFNYHRLRYIDMPNLSYQPSVDVLFESAVSHGPPVSWVSS